MRTRFSRAGLYASLLIAGISACAISTAEATVVRFTDAEVSGLINGTPVATNAWAAFGLSVSNAYWYVDAGDTFDTMGLSLYPPVAAQPVTAEITFTSVTSSVTVDFWSIATHGITVAAYDPDHNEIDFAAIGSSVNAYGTQTFTGNVKFLAWSGDGGHAQISTLTFGEGNNIREASVPEPSTLALIMVGLGLVGFSARRQRTRPT